RRLFVHDRFDLDRLASIESGQPREAVEELGEARRRFRNRGSSRLFPFDLFAAFYDWLVLFDGLVHFGSRFLDMIRRLFSLGDRLFRRRRFDFVGQVVGLCHRLLGFLGDRFLLFGKFGRFGSFFGDFGFGGRGLGLLAGSGFGGLAQLAIHADQRI